MRGISNEKGFNCIGFFPNRPLIILASCGDLSGTIVVVNESGSTLQVAIKHGGHLYGGDNLQGTDIKLGESKAFVVSSNDRDEITYAICYKTYGNMNMVELVTVSVQNGETVTVTVYYDYSIHDYSATVTY